MSFNLNYLINYDDAMKICDFHNNFNFYNIEYNINGYRIVCFNYFLCTYEMFKNPINDPNVHAFDMRGVTFIFDKDGNYERFLMLRKFFNVNENESTQYSDLVNKKIKNISIKEDGSLIAFMQLPDKTVFSKTIGGFSNEQSQEAMKIYKNNLNIKRFVDDYLNLKMTPLFEYVSYDNHIVLKYLNKELRLIGVRSNETGEFISSRMINNLKNDYDIDPIGTMHFESLSEICDFVKVDDKMEGFIIEFTDNQIVKWKTDWYFNAHKNKEVINREHDLIRLILDQKIDDILCNFTIEQRNDFLNQVNKIQNVINEYLRIKYDEIVDLCKLYEGDKKNFVINNKYNKNLSFALQYIFNHKPIKQQLVDYLKKKTNKLNVARNFLNNKGFKIYEKQNNGK